VKFEGPTFLWGILKINGIPKKTKIKTKQRIQPIIISRMGFLLKLIISKEIKG
jgi:hypothetical protein